MNDAVRRWCARVLVAVGAVVLLWGAADLRFGAGYRRQHEAMLARVLAAPVPEGQSSGPKALAVGEPVGRLEIARIGLSGVVIEGDEDAVLDYAIGHLPDTPLPWQAGNSALAGHRDGVFRPLQDVRPGDVLRLRTPYGDFHYRVRDIVIVAPDELWVLDTTRRSTLTLISCYPFNFIGPAPTRFIVRADRITNPYPTHLTAAWGVSAY